MRRNRKSLVGDTNGNAPPSDVVAVALPQKHRPLDILRYNLVDAVTIAGGATQSSSFPKSMYQMSFADGNTIKVAAKALHDSDQRAVTSCTPSFKERLQRTPPFVPSSSASARPQSIGTTSGAASPVISNSTYRHDFPAESRDGTASRLSDLKALPAAGRLLPRDPVDTTKRDATEASLARSTYVPYDVAAYQERMARVCEHQERIRQRHEHARAASVSMLFEATSLHRASYKRAVGSGSSASTPPVVRYNPEKAQTEALLAEKAKPMYYGMAYTSTQRGDYSMVARVQGTTAGASKSKAAARRGLPPPSSSATTPASSSWLLGTQDALAEERTRLSLLEAQNGRSSVLGGANATALSQQLSDMSVELVDPPACRAQTSFEIIPQKLPYPHATVHVPVAQCTGPDALARRYAHAAAHGGRPAGVSHKAVDAPPPTMHCCSGIFDEPVASSSATDKRSVSQMSYRPFRYQ